MFIEMFVYTSPNISMLKVYIILCKMMIDYNTVWVTYMFTLRHWGTYNTAWGTYNTAWGTYMIIIVNLEYAIF